jgi:hypothetical protein
MVGSTRDIKACARADMAHPEYHRRQAELFSQLAKVAGDPDRAVELERLAADHSAWAHRGESIGKRISKPTRKIKGENAT